MVKKVLVFILLALCIAASAFATTDISLEKTTDDRVAGFVERYTEGTPLDEYVEAVNIVDGILFGYDDENEYYTVYILYSDGNMANIDFLSYQVNMYS